ncbi:o-succinylbenzoate synthase [Alicyclobacillus sp. ALC3]|uniref:o-succinylbenzoate synthase n=1 Tax=Alicyclobacillus sp. ALC3 TaxID=2796143 RepID=UPI00237802F9|nr:o-succinylbenzoate synthase [Alicyclobacillus sp. ALC3]
MIAVVEVILHRLLMPLQMRVQTSYGVQTDRDLLLVELHTADGLVGWGESVAMNHPYYTEESTDTVEVILRRELIPLVLEHPWSHPSEFWQQASRVIGNPMAKFAVEGALWDLYAQQQGISLAQALGGTKAMVEVGVSIGICPIGELLAEVGDYLEQGYRRIKIKVQPGWDIEPVTAIRERFPDAPLMVDANGAYDRADDTAVLRLDGFGLMMIEQPFAAGSWERHSRLQAQMETPLCLDESITTLDAALRAIRLGACRIINVKPGRLGGFTPTLEVVRAARAGGALLWCGGMYETGVGRAGCVAMSALDVFTLPGDTAASRRYFQPDIIRPEVTVVDGQIRVPSLPGLGFEVDVEQVARYETEKWTFVAGG